MLDFNLNVPNSWVAALLIGWLGFAVYGFSYIGTSIEAKRQKEEMMETVLKMQITTDNRLKRVESVLFSLESKIDSLDIQCHPRGLSK